MLKGMDAGLLCHSCIMRHYTDSVSGRTVRDTVHLTNVRIMPRRERSCDGDAEREKCCGVLYYDVQHSLPADADIIIAGYETEIEWEGKTYSVTGIRYVYDRDCLHHLEIILGG